MEGGIIVKEHTIKGIEGMIGPERDKATYKQWTDDVTQ
jgi:hypothetical protein